MAIFSTIPLYRVCVFVVVNLLNCVWFFVTPWAAACQSPLFCTISQSLIKFIFMKLVMLSIHLILCCPLLLLPSIFPSIRGFSNELALLIRWTKYWSFTFSDNTSNEYSGLISFRVDWFGLSSVISSTTIRKHLFLGAQPPLWSNSHIHT